MTRMAIAFLAIFSLTGTQSAAGEPCDFQSEPEILRHETNSLLQVWTEHARPVLTSHTLPPEPSLHDFRAAVSEPINVNAIVMLEAQLPHVSGGDATNVQMVLDKKASSIDAMNCLEALLLSVQIQRSVERGKPMYSSPTEFFSFVLSRDEQLKIYYYTTYQAGVRGLAIFNKLLDKDISDGWRVIDTIHNHSIFPESDTPYGGVVPSATDIQYFRNAAARFDIPRASITNGFNTIRIPRSDFEKFSIEPYE